MKLSPIAFAFALSSTFALASAPQLHNGPWPIQNGHNHQPTQHELGALHMQDVTPDQAREIDRLYEQLLSAMKRDAIGVPDPWIDPAVT
jgi:Spy/CpxP family protein refolding chaperone